MVNFVIQRNIIQCVACLRPPRTHKYTVPTDLDIEPTLITYNGTGNGKVHVHISNITTKTVTINRHSLLCEVQQVTVRNFPALTVPSETSDVLSKIDLPRDGLDEDQLQKVHTLLKDFKSLFSKGDDDIGYCPFVEHHVEMSDLISRNAHLVHQNW
jgi:hypothetical protein